MYIDKKRIAEGKFATNWKQHWDNIKSQRNFAANSSAAVIRQMKETGMYAPYDFVGNENAAQLPTEAYRTFDEVTKTVMRHDEGQMFFNDLMDLAKPLHIGKTVNQYRYSTDATQTFVSIDGKDLSTVDKVNYDFEGDPVPIFQNGFGREWREMESHQSEQFDSMMDDQEAGMADLKQSMAQFILDGDSSIKVKGFEAQGIKNHRNRKAIDLGAAGANIDLTSNSTTSDQIITFFTQFYGGVLDDNFIMQDTTVWISPEMARRFDEPYSRSAGFKEGSLLERIKQIPRIGSVRQTFELSGNEWFSYVKDSRFIRPLVGAAAATIAIPRTMPFQDYNYTNWAAMGIQIKRDTNARAGVFYASEA